MRLCRHLVFFLAAIVNQSASNGVQAFARQIKISSQWCSQATGTFLTQTKKVGLPSAPLVLQPQLKTLCRNLKLKLESDWFRLEAFSDGCLSTQFLGSKGYQLSIQENWSAFPEICFPKVNTLAIRMNLASMQDLLNILQDADSKQFLRIVKHPTLSMLHGYMWNQVLHNRTP